MSEVLASAEDQQITECEEYALCHGEVTRKKSYTSQKVKKSMASMGTDWYQKAFAPGEARLVMADEKKKKLAERAQERQCKQLREQEQDRLKKLCAAEVASAEDFQALQRSDGKDKVFSNLTRIGLLSAIREASESEADSPQVAERVKAKVVPGKPGGIAAALLLSGSGLVNKHNAQLMVRLVTALPPGSFGREILAESMVKAAEVWVRSQPTLTAREVQLRWAFQMLESLRRLSTVPHLDSPSLCLLFGNIMVMQGSSSYCLGNLSIARQLRHWVLKEARHSDLPQPTEMLGKEEKDEVEEKVEDQGGDAEGGKGDPEGGEGDAAGGQWEAELEAATADPLAPQEITSMRAEDPAEAAAADPAEAAAADQDQDEPANPGKKRATVDDPFLIHLLHHYIVHAADPTR